MTLTNKQISKKYNRFSLFYDFIERPIEKKLFSKWRKELLKEVKGRVLEIGVGTGKNFPYYNHEKVDLTAIDISKGMLNKAKKKINYSRAIKSKLPTFKARGETVIWLDKEDGTPIGMIIKKTRKKKGDAMVSTG